MDINESGRSKNNIYILLYKKLLQIIQNLVM